MGAYRLIETAVDLIQTQIQNNIAGALANVRTLRADAIVTTEPPKEYFIYEEAQVYRPPSVFIIAEDQNIRNEAKNANHINAMDLLYVAVVVEDRVRRLATIKAWRYQAALMQVLHQVTLTSADKAVRLFSRVKSCKFSGLVNIKVPNSSEDVFRKEVCLIMNIEHIENLE